MLELKPLARSGSGLDMSKWTHVYQFIVTGLPFGEEAMIAEFGHRWSFLRVSNGKQQGTWTGKYESPEMALEALRLCLPSADQLEFSGTMRND